jgi:hypothetical protein
MRPATRRAVFLTAVAVGVLCNYEVKVHWRDPTQWPLGLTVLSCAVALLWMFLAAMTAYLLQVWWWWWWWWC